MTCKDFPRGAAVKINHDGFGVVDGEGVVNSRTSKNVYVDTVWRGRAATLLLPPSSLELVA